MNSGEHPIDVAAALHRSSSRRYRHAPISEAARLLPSVSAPELDIQMFSVISENKNYR